MDSVLGIDYMLAKSGFNRKTVQNVPFGRCIVFIYL